MGTRDLRRSEELDRAYADRMPVTARDVAEALRSRLPGLPTKKLHKLLYYCQGHHLATFDVPLFPDPVSAWDMGPVVGPLWYQERTGTAFEPPIELTEGQLNTVEYVVSRYGRLSGRDLETLTHHEDPWIRADARRQPGTSARITHESMAAWFRNEPAAQEVALDVEVVAKWLADAAERRTTADAADDLDALRDYLIS